MKYIIATSDTDYFRWQILVQINNFKKLGMLDDVTYVVSVENRISNKLKHIKEATGARIETYRDDRQSNRYQPSVTAHVLKKHFKNNPKESKLYYYLDPDVIFREKPEYPQTYYKTDKWILSDTRSYIDSKYIKGKSEELFRLMCDDVGISPELVIKYDNAAGGAQYIIKNAGYEYWDKVEKNCESLYFLMKSTSKKYSPEHPIQSWTAEMWSVLWNAWLMGHRTLIDHRMNFSWATDPISKYDKSLIYHNAGVFDQKNLFNKSLFSTKHPFNEDFSYVSNEYCSSKYVEEILDTKNNYEKLINNL